MFIGCAEEQKKWRIGVSQCSEDIWRHKIYHARIGAFADYNVDVGEELAELRDC